MILSLTGMMGCGKSSVGRALARRLGVPFFDLDELICQRSGKDIPTLFREGGEPGFRHLEQQTLEALLDDGPESTFVLSLGGGTVLTPACAALVRERTRCFYLRARPETLQRRLSRDPGARPLLQDEHVPERIRALLEEREPIYESVASDRIDTDPLPIDALVGKIENILKTE